MAKLPTALDLSGPGSFRSGRQYFSADASAAGRGLAAFGADLSAIGAERKQQENGAACTRHAIYGIRESATGRAATPCFLAGA
mgnify:CR=1 FL=1